MELKKITTNIIARRAYGIVKNRTCFMSLLCKLPIRWLRLSTVAGVLEATAHVNPLRGINDFSGLLFLQYFNRYAVRIIFSNTYNGTHKDNQKCNCP